MTVPADLKRVLATNREAKTIFDSFAYSHKKEIVDWFSSAKHEETKARRREEVITLLLKKHPKKK